MRFLKLLPLFLLALPLSAHAEQTLKIATLAPDGSSWMNDMRAAADEISKRTEGRVKFKFYPGGVMGNDQSVLRKIRIGQLHGAAFTGGGLADVYPGIRIYGLPFLFNNLEEVDYLRGKMDAELEQGLEDAGFVNFGFAEGGFAKIMSLNPVRSTEDLDNEKAWVPEGDNISYRVLSALGVSPVSMPITDVLTGLQTGLISVVGASPLGALAFQWHTRVEYMTDEPLAYLLGVLAIQERAFGRISEEDQVIVREVMDRLYDEFDRQNRKDNANAHEALGQQGVEFIDPNAETIAQWRKTAEKVNREMAEEGEFPVDLTERAYRLLEQYRTGNLVSN
ncbi:MAG: TRAP transporter substrate-binding protein DctP [Gammaproteobacteria bacterium]|nr:TRAP transporter substrate-binding protein DctP [Gammaproteobacteria bacterium]